MPKYTVTSPLRHNAEEFAPGDTVEMSAKEAKLIPHAVELIKEAKSSKDDKKEGGEQK